MRRWTTTRLMRILVAPVIVLATAAPASAFYWKGWPGSLLPPDRTLVPPGDQTKPGSPPVPGGEPELPPGGELPPPPPGGPPPSENVPEPGTALLGLLGLGGLAAGRWARRAASRGRS